VEGIPRLSFLTNWALAPNEIYFMPAEDSSLRFFDLASKKVNQLFEMKGRWAMGLSVSPDPHWVISSSRIEQADSDVVLVDHMR
jgi:hypothetical protein